MFESDEFDVDEDFLKDVDEKVEEYFSQRNESDNEPSPKRHKLDNPLTDFSDINFDDEPDFARNARKTIETQTKILENIPLTFNEKSSKNENKTCVTDDKNVEERRNLALQILRRGASEKNSARNASKTIETQSKITENISLTFDEKKNENEACVTDDKNVEERRNLALQILRRGSSEENSTSLNFSRKSSHSPQKSNQSSQNDKNVETFKKPIQHWSKSAPKTVARGEKYSPQPRMTLIRKFPGPAGLLPDSPDLDANNTIFLNRLDENKIDSSENLDDSNISEYFSQNTERMFSVGAWRSMLDDLPSDFLKDHEIATIKRRARNNGGSSENSRASFLAGVVQRIDHSLENPRLVLKDLGDSIEAIMHRDISLAHPNVIEPGVVLLLRDVGLLGFQGSQKCLGLQFHVIIAPKNLLAVYSEKSRLITSPWMQSLLGEETNSDNKISFGEETNSDNKISFGEETNSDNKIVSSNFESDDDEAFATVDIAAISDSQIAATFSETPNISTENKKRKPIDEIAKTPKIIKTNENIQEKIEIRPKRITSVKLKLLKYRSEDVLTPPVADIDNSAGNKETQLSKDEVDITNLGTFADNLLDSDNDTEDEILSQLDMESIVTNYNSRT